MEKIVAEIKPRSFSTRNILSSDHLNETDDDAFFQIRQWVNEWAGITVADHKKEFVYSRLANRLRELGVEGISAYVDYVRTQGGSVEKQNIIDALTTNETYFYREAVHFDFLRKLVRERKQTLGRFNVWSAACSSGEEAYSIAMCLAEQKTLSRWKVLGTDINASVLASAREGSYKLRERDAIPGEYLRRFCISEHTANDSRVLIRPEIKRNMKFERVNLHEKLNGLGSFDVIFLRNVMIYFSMEDRKKLVEKLCAQMRPGGYLIVSRTERIHEDSNSLSLVSPSIYQKS